MNENREILSSLYFTVYDLPYNRKAFSDRLKMQKMVYLLCELGVECGPYSFRWYKYGPYSQKLMDDMLCLPGLSEKLNLPENSRSRKKISFLKNLISLNDYLDEHTWVEILASLYYLRNNGYSHLSDEELINELINRKPKLNGQKKTILRLFKEATSVHAQGLKAV